MNDQSHAAEMAYRCLLRIGSGTLPVQPEAMLRLCRRTVLYTYDEAMLELGMSRAAFERQCGAADAFTLRAEMSNHETRYVVCYRTDGNRARLRFTLAHELGHIVLGHTGDAAAEEAEADCFASHLLCPRPVLKMMGDVTPARIAAVFYVSESAARRACDAETLHVNPQLMIEVQKLFCSELIGPNDENQQRG